MKEFIISISLIICFPMSVTAKDIDFEEKIFGDHHLYLESSITKRRFKHESITAALEKIRRQANFKVSQAGESVEGRSLNLVRYGKGDIKVLLWSQMHGDESTATMALLDIFNFLAASDQFDSFRDTLASRLTLYFVPMLNPDGAERFQRRNAIGIDLNRDALRREFSESRVLKSLVDKIKPDFGFNLHDQKPFYTAGRSAKPATISFLAPPFDYERSVDDGRLDAIRLISLLNRRLQQFIPGQVGKYSDEFEPRAFGDNIQKWGASTVLVESGGYPDDPEKQQIRKLNFVLLLSAFKAIAEKEYESEDPEGYEAIPNNEEYLFHLLIREAAYSVKGHKYRIDLGINRKEIDAEDHLSFHQRSFIEDMGDLSVFWGYEEIDAAGLEIVEGKAWPENFESVRSISMDTAVSILKKGYTEVVVREKPENFHHGLPLTVLYNTASRSNSIQKNRNPNFLLKGDGKYQYAIVNGFIFNLNTGKNNVLNGLVEKGYED